ncbi:C6 transcription factor, putative [Aspergillus udagawae]|nr:C6 transcription factor, putative [Aspergillus udagawae]
MPPPQAVDPQMQSRPPAPTSQSQPQDQNQYQNKIIQDQKSRVRRLEEQLPGPPLSRDTTGPNPSVSQTQALQHLHDRVLGAQQQLSDAFRPSSSINGWGIPATLPRLRIARDKTKCLAPVTGPYR